MKRNLLLLIMVFVATVVNAQDTGNSSNNNYRRHGSISVGYGNCHGGLGAKVLLDLGSAGTGNDGIFVGIGTFSSHLFWSAGIQWSSDNWYMTLLYGNLAVESTTVTTSGGYYSYDEKVISGASITLGYMLDLDQKNKWFLDGGAGISYGDNNQWFFAFDFAVGMRF